MTDRSDSPSPIREARPAVLPELSGKTELKPQAPPLPSPTTPTSNPSRGDKFAAESPTPTRDPGPPRGE